MYQVRVWTTKKMDCTNISSPTVIRKRVTAPNTEYRRFVTNELGTTSEDAAACSSADAESPNSSHSLQPRILNFGTPESTKKRVFALFQEEVVDVKSPESRITSPSSVLSPPPSLKRRTIRDYFSSSTS
jgi:denticleless